VGRQRERERERRRRRRKEKALGCDRIYFERFGAGGTSTSVFLFFVIR
jgi:hypothetical protein